MKGLPPKIKELKILDHEITKKIIGVRGEWCLIKRPSTTKAKKVLMENFKLKEDIRIISGIEPIDFQTYTDMWGNWDFQGYDGKDLLEEVIRHIGYNTGYAFDSENVDDDLRLVHYKAGDQKKMQDGRSIEIAYYLENREVEDWIIVVDKKRIYSLDRRAGFQDFVVGYEKKILAYDKEHAPEEEDEEAIA